MGGSNWEEMGAMSVGIAGGGVCGDRASSVSSPTVVVLFVRLCLLPDTREIRRTPLINPR